MHLMNRLFSHFSKATMALKCQQEQKDALKVFFIHRESNYDYEYPWKQYLYINT